MSVDFLYLAMGLAVFAAAGFSLIIYLEKNKRNKEI